MTDTGVIPVAVTFTVTDDGSGSTHRGLAVNGEDDVCCESSSVSYFFGGIPQLPYTVTYRLSPDGQYEVRDDDYDDVPMITDYEGLNFLCVCLLPRSWKGRRISRDVAP